MRYILSQFNYLRTGHGFSTKISTSIHSLLGKESPITRVRIWKSGYFFEHGSQKKFVFTNVAKSFLVSTVNTNKIQSNIGHVSIETKEIYASLWPEEGIIIYNKYKPQQGIAKSRTPALDEKTEARPPDYLIDLYTLDVDNIKQKLEEYLESGPIYHLIGNNRFFKHLGANSCSGLAYDLLISGGIKKLMPTTNFIRDYIVTTPNNLAQLVLEAHANEQAILRSTGGNDANVKPSHKP